MPRYAAFLRGVSPMNAKMPELKRAFERAGFTDVRTLLSSGNVLFTARSASVAALQKRAEKVQPFMTIVRPVEELRELIARDPFGEFRLPPNGKKVVTFLRSPPRAKPKLPIELHGARMLAIEGGEVFSVYVPGPRGPVFMSLIEKTFGKDVTTRTWDTVRKAAS